MRDNNLHLEDTTIEDALKTFQTQYLKEDFPNALLTLKENKDLLPEGLWHFNMGTVMGKLNDWPMARYHFILSEKLGMTSSELSRNKQVLSEKLELDKWEKPLETSDYLIRAALAGTEGIFTTISLLLLVCGVWLLRRKQQVRAGVVTLLICLVPIGLNIWIESWSSRITLEAIALHEAPSAIFGTRGEIPAGIFLIIKQKEGWEKVIYPSRFSGWIKPIGLQPLELR